MEDMDKTFVDIDELARRIDERIKELEELNNIGNTKEEEYANDTLGSDMDELNKLIAAIDKRILELEELEQKEEEKEAEFNINIEELTEKVNKKLDELSFEDETEDLEKTFYDLNEISKIINDTIKKLEKQKEKKRKKAMYCDLARKNARKKCNCKKKNNK